MISFYYAGLGRGFWWKFLWIFHSDKHQRTIQNGKFSRSSTSMISFCPFNSQIRKSEKQKTFDEWNGESDRSGNRSSSFIVNKARISVQLQLQLQLITQRSSMSRSVDLTSNGMGNHYLRDVDHGSTLSCALQDRIFHIYVWLDIWRCRPTRINVRLNTPHRKAMNSNGNQVCRVFSRTRAFVRLLWN